ncbi:MAG: DNA replication protein DnaC [Planctomycetota bacterium]|jgi:DNA replication protein DnaC
MSDSTTIARIEMWLVELRMPTMKREYAKVAKVVAKSGGDYLTFLHTLLEEELGDRRARRVQRRIKEARFPQLRRLSDLDAKELPKGVWLELLNELARGVYITEGGNVIAVGPSGTGKTHVCDALGLVACEQGKRVRRYTATGLVSELEEAQEKKQLHRYLSRFGKHDLVVVDELGYMPISEHGADLFFQALSERHERGSVIVNTNLPFDEWGQIFRTERLAVALLDRLTHRAQILEMNGESYRLKSARQRKSKGGDGA